MDASPDSPQTQSSDEDFAAFLDEELDSGSPNSAKEEEKEDNGNTAERIKRQKLDLENSDEAAEADTLSGPFLEKTEEPENVACEHPGFIKDMCIRCGKTVDNVTAVPLGYIHKDLKLANDELTRLRNDDVKKMLLGKKLYLVLDLDHTVLNSTRLDDVSPDEEYLMSQTHSLQDISNGSLFRLDMMRMVTKLRPFIRTFLKEASALFEMYIYTMGEQPYAVEMAKLLDPGNVYFDSRVISQSDCTTKFQKGLDVLLGMETNVIILDDTLGVWKRHEENVILMDRYHFFSSSCRVGEHGATVKSLSQLKSDENETDGALATVLEILKRAHSMFFDPERSDDVASRDVREALKTIRKEVLKDCKIIFSRVIQTGSNPRYHPLWKLAEKLGATCCTELDPSVTHVVSFDAGTDKSRWAVRHKKFLVHPRWIEAAHYLWRRQPEDKFPVTHNNKQ